MNIYSNYDSFQNRLLGAVTLLLSCLPGITLAQFAHKRQGVGGVANHVMSPVVLFSDMIYTGCLVIGVSFLFASIIKYREHKRSPLMVPMGTVVFLLVAGIVLLLFPLLSLYYSGAVKYSFF